MEKIGNQKFSKLITKTPTTPTESWLQFRKN